MPCSGLPHSCRNAPAVLAEKAFRLFGTALRFDHNDGSLCPVSALLKRFGSSLGRNARRFTDDAPAAPDQLLIRRLDVHHQIAVYLPAFDHRACREHVQNHFLGGAAFHTGGARDHFRAGHGGDGNVGKLLDMYRSYKCLYEIDNDWGGFEWINANDADRSIYSFLRKCPSSRKGLVFILNMTPVKYENAFHIFSKNA